MTARRFLNDPLFHFIAAGAVVFALASALAPGEQDDETIVVDRAALLAFIQYRSKAFDPAAAAALLDKLDDAERARLVADFAREEALVREAAALGLDANDYVIRRRLAQKVEFLAEAAAAPAAASQAEVAAWYQANAGRYHIPASATLTHVFVSGETNAPADAFGNAQRLLERLRGDRAGFKDAPKYGDRFLFHKNYVDRTDNYIKSQLGADVARAVFDEAAPLEQWLGPYRSDYGQHLIFIAARTPERLPRFSEMEEIASVDFAEERRQQAIDRAIDDIVAKYKIENRLDDGA